MKKWLRNYKAKMIRGRREGLDWIAEEEIVIQYPITCIFDIKLGVFETSNYAIFEFFNLSPDIQAKLWKDKGDESRFVTIEFYAGYDNDLPLIFKGNFIFCNTYQPNGSTEIITTAQAAFDSSLWNDTYVNYTFYKGTDLSDILDVLLKDNKNIFTGYITPKIPPLRRNKTFLGQPLELLEQEFAGYKVFIDVDERLNILDENEVLPGDIQVITAASGLLGSPRRSDTLVDLETIFEPGIKPGQAIKVIDEIVPFMNQYYQVLEVHHRGTISGAVCGSVVTTLNLTLLGENFEVLKNKKDLGFIGEQTTGEWLKPVKGIRISSPFGKRIKPRADASEYHNGIDIAAPLEATVIAPVNGKITQAHYYGGYGNYIEINHGQNTDGQIITTAYAHLNKILVNTGDMVSAGQTIGLVGSTGASTGNHLHFEIRLNGQPVNPIPYIGTY